MDCLTAFILSKLSNAGSGGGGETQDPYLWKYLGYNSKVDEALDTFQYSWELLQNWDATTTDGENAFKDDTNIVYFPKIDTSNVTNMYGFLSGCTNLKSVPSLNTANVTSMRNFVYNCSNLEHIELMNTSKVENFRLFFGNCAKLTELPLFDTSSATTIYGMAMGCIALTSFPEFNTQNVEDMDFLCWCTSTAELKNFPVLNVSKLKTMQSAFANCTKLTNASLNNIMAMCANVTDSFTMERKITNLGFTTLQVNNCQMMPNWASAQANGWTV